MRITVVGSTDLPELLSLVRAYCDFYQVTPSDRELLELSRSLLADPQREGLQLLARDHAGSAIGFATLYWTWQTLAAARVGVMNDLFVAPEARGMGVAEGLIAACQERCREHGATRLVWQTASDNHRAQAVYARVGPPAMIGGWTTTCRSNPSDLVRRRAFALHTGTVSHCDLPFFGEDEQCDRARRSGEVASTPRPLSTSSEVLHVTSARD
jgi:GNAT superfamily N-acetyltransferase